MFVYILGKHLSIGKHLADMGLWDSNHILLVWERGVWRFDAEYLKHSIDIKAQNIWQNNDDENNIEFADTHWYDFKMQQW